MGWVEQRVYLQYTENLRQTGLVSINGPQQHEDVVRRGVRQQLQVIGGVLKTTTAIDNLTINLNMNRLNHKYCHVLYCCDILTVIFCKDLQITGIKAIN